MTEIETYKGHTIEIEYDLDPESPRDWCNMGTMACWHRRYELGDVQPQCTPREHLVSLLPDNVQARCMEDDDYLERMLYKHVPVLLPLYLYDHSGVTMSTSPFSCPWDSGQVGVVYITRQRIRDEYGWRVLTKHRLELVRRCLEAEVETYAAYLEGSVFGFTVRDPDGEVVDSTWGYYGNDHEASGLLPDARGVIDTEHRVKQLEMAV